MALKSGRIGVRNDQVDFYGRLKGGSGEEYTAGDGIVIVENEISIDEQVVAVKGDLQDYATTEMLDDYATIEMLDGYATKTDLEDKQNTIVDSDEIVVDSEEDKLLLAQAVSNKLARALVTPTQTPTADKLVGVDTSNAQEMIGIGDGLEIDNGVLKATGGTGGVTSLGGATGVITLGSGLSMSNNTLSASGGGGASIGGGFNITIFADSGDELTVLVLGGPIRKSSGDVISGQNYYGWHLYGFNLMDEYIENAVMLIPISNLFTHTTKMHVGAGVYGYDGSVITSSNIGSYVNKIIYVTQNTNMYHID